MANPRADFVPIVDRPPLHLPDGARVAVLLVVNVEQKELDEPMGSPLSQLPPGSAQLPEVPAFSRFEYGLRVGFWRMLRETDRLEIRPTMALNASVLEGYERVVQAGVESGWDIVGHGYYQRPLPAVEDERATVRRTLDAIEAATGKRPRGWLGPGMSETFETPDILAEEGVSFVMDWLNDDQPYPLKVSSGSLLSVPYTNELNDIGVYIRQGSAGPELPRRVADHLDTLMHDEPETARVLPIGTHPFIMGQPHRFPYFVQMLESLKSTPGVVFMTATEIYEWYVGEVQNS
ncbi:MAG: polysaccharide deacetylase family protein [Chloroflexi bacterium]|nr:polysaccharide deacetylase family protein [Chloroflexota bacterium]